MSKLGIEIKPVLNQECQCYYDLLLEILVTEENIKDTYY